MAEEPDARSTHSTSSRHSVVPGLLPIAGSIAGGVLIGWMFDLPVLEHFGADGYPMWPLAAIGYIFLTIGFRATMRRSRITPFLLAFPIAIGFLALLGEVAGISPGRPRPAVELANLPPLAIMGIGLSISRRSVEAHGGMLVAENRPDKGAIFSITLPALEEIEE